MKLLNRHFFSGQTEGQGTGSQSFLVSFAQDPFQAAWMYRFALMLSMFWTFDVLAVVPKASYALIGWTLR